MSRFATSSSQASGLASALPAKVVLPSDHGWGEARQAWAQHVDQRPAAVVYPESAQDVAAVVLFARQRGFRIAPQGTGHQAAPLGGLADTILVKTARRRGVVIDAGARIARLDAGVRAADLQHATARQGLAALTHRATVPAQCTLWTEQTMPARGTAPGGAGPRPQGRRTRGRCWPMAPWGRRTALW